MIKAVIFDFDGTVSNRQKNAYTVFEGYLRQYFSDLSDFEYEAVLQDMMLYDCNGSINVGLRLVPFIRKYGDRLPEDFSEVFVPFYFNTMYQSTTLKPETLEVLETLKRQGYKLGLLSNGDSFSQHNKIKKVKIEDLFDEVIVSGDIGIDKPDRRIFDIMVERLGVKNEECMMVGDVFSSDILGAYNAGILPVWIVTDPEKPAKHYTGYRIGDLRELYAILEKENNGI